MMRDQKERPRDPQQLTAFRIPGEELAALDRTAALLGQPRSAVIRWSLRETGAIPVPEVTEKVADNET